MPSGRRQSPYVQPMIGRLLAWWVLTTAALGVAVLLVGSVTVTGFGGLAVAGLVLALLNAFLRPILAILGAPLHVITLGLSLFLVDVAIIALTAYLVDALEVGGFVSVLEVTLIVWATGLALHLVFRTS
jgi:putative membrane protein